MSTNSTATTLWNAIYGFANATPNRVPFTCVLAAASVPMPPSGRVPFTLLVVLPRRDWYDTISAGQKGFQARPVIGGLYAYSVLNG